MSSQTSTPREDLRHLFFGFRVSQALYAVAELGIADLLGEEPQSADDLAAASGAHARPSTGSCSVQRGSP